MRTGPAGCDPDTATDHVSVTELHRRHYRALVQLAALMVDHQHLAEELVQDAFTELVNRWDSVEPSAALAYLRRAVTNGARSVLRRRRTARAHHWDQPLPSPSAESRVLQAAGYDALLAGIAELPLRQRQVVVLRYFADCSIAETAAALNVSEAAVTTSTHWALRALAELKESLR